MFLVPVTRVAILVLAIAAVACATPIQVHQPPDAPVRAVGKIAVVPFSLGQPLTTRTRAINHAESIAGRVTSQVLSAFSAYPEITVIPPGDVDRVISAGGPMGAPTSPKNIGRALWEIFGTEAVLYGTVRRYDARQGGDRGVRKPAGVWFDVELRSMEGQLMWSASYDEIQRSVAEDMGSFSRAASRGFRWISAEELTRYGAQEVVDALIRDSESWK